MARVEHPAGFDDERRLVPLRRQLQRDAASLGVVAVLLAVAVVLAFDPSITGWFLVEFATFFAVFGVVTYVERSKHLPGSGELPPPPADARVEDPATALGWRTLWAGAAAVVVGTVLAWIFDDPEMVVCVVVGHSLGSVAATLAAAVRVRRWEAAHGGVVVAPEEGSDDEDPASPRLFAQVGPW